MTLDILCMGEPLMELNAQADGRYLAGFGGDTSNCAVAAARSGARVGYAAHIGADGFGADFMALWRAEGIDTRAVHQRVDGPTGIYFVTHGPEGHAFSYYRAGSASSLMRTADLPQMVLAEARILHVSGISQAISTQAADAVFAAIDIVKRAGGRISYDSNLREKLWPLDRARAVIHAGMAKCDIALPGIDDATALTGLSVADQIVDFYLGLGAQIVALTLGAKGALVATPQARAKVPGHDVAARDATGAGDTFDGAFLARIVAGDSPFDAARYANAAAALSTLGYGAVGPMPRSGEVRAFLAERGSGT